MNRFDIAYKKFREEYIFLENYKAKWPDQYELIKQFKKSIGKINIIKMENNINKNDESISLRLKSTLLDNIEKLKADPGYMPQAKVIKDQIQTLINMKKLDLEVAKFELDKYKIEINTKVPQEGIESTGSNKES